MSTDLTTLAVALVGVAGTMGAPWLTQRARRSEARDQAEREEKAHESTRRDKLVEEKRALCVALNSATRTYRSALRDCALEPSMEGLAALDQARAAYREQFSQAEMVLPQRPFEVAVTVNEHLGYSYKLVLDFVTSKSQARVADQALSFIRGPLVVAVELLRLALREDLGVVERVADLEAQLAVLPIRPRIHQLAQPLEPPVEAA